MSESSMRGDGSVGATREDVLIGRVVDGEASPADWNELEALAERDGGVWARLAESQRAHARLASAVEDVISLAELVEARAVRAPGAGAVIGRIGGWAAAAAIALAWGVMAMRGGQAGPTPSPAEMQVADAPPSEGVVGGVETGAETFRVDLPSAAEAFDQYMARGLAEGSVWREEAPLLLYVRPAENGDGFETVYMRRVLERKTVPDLRLVRPVVDEAGNVVDYVEEAPPLFGEEPI